MSLIYSLERIFYRKNKSIPQFREYDKRRGFTAWSDECRAVAARPKNALEDNPLGQQGFTRVRVFSEDEAAEIKQRFDRQDTKLRDSKNSENSQMLDSWNLSGLKEVIGRAITPEVDRILYAYFGSEYAPYWYSMQRALPNHEARRPFLWHCDKGPSMFAKMLLYFTAVADTGGNTHVLDRQTTLAFDRAGYNFGSGKNRLEDLTGFAEQHRIKFTPMSYDLRPGEAVLILPQMVLHRGVMPSKAPRFIMQVTFVPSKIHWREALFKEDRKNMEELARDYAWPKHASQFRPLLSN